MEEKPEMYMTHTFNPLTLDGHKRYYQSKDKAIAYYNRLVKHNRPVSIHELIRTCALFNSWQILKDDGGNSYFYGDWKPYFVRK